MSELSDAVTDSVAAHRPGDAPPFSALVRRRASRRRRRAVATAALALAVVIPGAAMALASSGGADADQVIGGEPTPGTQALVVRVQYDPSTYDAVREQKVLDQCSALAGVQDVQVAESFPPQITLTLTGTIDQNAAVMVCLTPTGTTSVTSREISRPDPADPDAPSSSGVAAVRACPFEDRGNGARCRVLSDPAGVDRLVGLLESGRSAVRPCPDKGRQVEVQLESGNATTVYVDECGNATEGATRFSLVPEARDAAFALLDSPVEVQTSIFVTFDPATFRPDEDRVTTCFGLPGVVSGGTTSVSDGSDPPTYTLFVAGSRDELQRALDCARATPGARVTEASAPVPATFTVFENPKPQDTTVALNVFEQSCASGVPATGRVADPEVDYGPTEIRVAIAVTPVAAGARCPGNPATFYVLELDQPVGTRKLVDANTR